MSGEGEREKKFKISRKERKERIKKKVVECIKLERIKRKERLKRKKG